MTEDEGGGEVEKDTEAGRPLKKARREVPKPPLSSLTSAARAVLGLEGDAATMPSTAEKFFALVVKLLPGALPRGAKGGVPKVTSMKAPKYQSTVDAVEAFVARRDGTGGAGEGGASGSGGQTSGGGGGGGGGSGSGVGGSGAGARGSGAVANGAAGGGRGSTAPIPRGSVEYNRIGQAAIVLVTTEAIENISERIESTAKTPPPKEPTLEHAAGRGRALMEGLSPRFREHCVVDALIEKVKHLAPPSAGEELKEGMVEVLNFAVGEQRQKGVLRIIKNLALRKNSDGDQRTPTTPEVLDNYLGQVSKPSFSPESLKVMEATVRSTRRAAVDGVRALTARHAGRPFSDATAEDQWGAPESIGELHGVLTKQLEAKKEKGRGGNPSHKWTEHDSHVAAGALREVKNLGGGLGALKAARQAVAARLALPLKKVTQHMQPAAPA